MDGSKLSQTVNSIQRDVCFYRIAPNHHICGREQKLFSGECKSYMNQGIPLWIGMA
jgi:hypothetical protein